MMLLDVRTFLVVAALCAAVSSLGFLVIATTYPRTIKGVFHWSAANALQFVGGILLALRGTVPDVVSIVVANTLVTLSAALYYQALADFHGKPTSHRVPAIVGGMVLVSFSYFGLINPQEQVRVFLASACVSTLTLLCTWTLTAYGREVHPLISRCMAGGFFLISVVWMARAIHAVVGRQPAQSAFEPNLLDSIAYSAVLLMIILETFGFMLLINLRVTAELQRLAAQDPLTEVCNRRTIEAIAARAVAHSQRSVAPCAVILLDVDLFKNVNDTYGHPVGDSVLREVAASLRRTVRAQDSVGRFGGEEFIVVLPGTSMAGALFLAERLRKIIAETPIQIEGHILTVTISGGVAALSPKDAGAEAMIRRADRALYMAKDLGRNRVVEDSLEPQSPWSEAGKVRRHLAGQTLRKLGYTSSNAGDCV